MIRREILALEALEIPIVQFSLRSCFGKVVDKLERQELEKTGVVLSVGMIRLFSTLLKVALTRPKRRLTALKLTIKMGWNSDRRVLFYCAYLAEACVLLDTFSKLNISHFHSPFGTNSTTVVLLNPILGGPSYSFTVHGHE